MYLNFKHGLKFDLEVTNNVTGQIKVRMFDFSGLVTLTGTISLLSANKGNESSWIVSLTLVSFPVLCDHNTGQGHLRSPGKKVKQKNRDLELRYMFLGQIFAKNAKMT